MLLNAKEKALFIEYCERNISSSELMKCQLEKLGIKSLVDREEKLIEAFSTVKKYIQEGETITYDR